MKAGDRIITPQGIGTVQWTRNAPPTFTDVESVSVRVDALAAGRFGYNGTVWPIGRLEPATELDELVAKAVHHEDSEAAGRVCDECRFTRGLNYNQTLDLVRRACPDVEEAAWDELLCLADEREAN